MIFCDIIQNPYKTKNGWLPVSVLPLAKKQIKGNYLIFFIIFYVYLSQLAVICNKLVRYNFFRRFVNLWLFGTSTGTSNGTVSNKKEGKSDNITVENC